MLILVLQLTIHDLRIMINMRLDRWPLREGDEAMSIPKVLLYALVVIVNTVVTGLVVWFLLRNEPDFQADCTFTASTACALGTAWAFILFSL